jgi:hypothetical protein
MTDREQLIEEIKQAPDSLVAELLNLLLMLKSRQTQAEADEDDGQVERQTVLQRMGGVPQYLLSAGGVSDRDRRRVILSSKIQRRYRTGL